MARLQEEQEAEIKQRYSPEADGRTPNTTVASPLDHLEIRDRVHIQVQTQSQTQTNALARPLFGTRSMAGS